MGANKREDRSSDISFSDLIDDIISKKFTICYGCSTFIDENSVSVPFCACDLPPVFSKELSCPCIECLIKMVCTEECDKVRNYASNLSSVHRRVIENLIDDELERRHKKENEQSSM
jgi:hypothetical protein